MQTVDLLKKPSTGSQQNSAHIDHLIASLGRIDLLLQREVQRWRLAGQDPNDDFRGLYVSDALAETLLGRPFGASWGDGVALEPLEEAYFSSAIEACAARVDQLRREALKNEFEPRLDRLQVLFDLDDFERDTLLVCLAPALDLRYERVYGYLQDDVTRKHPSANLILSLLCDPGPNRLERLAHFGPGSPLLNHHLLEPVQENGTGKAVLLNQSFQVDESVVAWLLGRYQPHARIKAQVEFIETSVCQPGDDILAGCAWIGLKEDLRSRPDLLENCLLAFTGPDQAAQEATARLLAASLNRPLLRLDLAAVMGMEESVPEAVAITMRDACLTGALLFIHGWDACLVDGSPATGLMAELGGAGVNRPAGVIVAGQAAWLQRNLPDGAHVYFLEFQRPAYSQRKQIWETLTSLYPGGLAVQTSIQPTLANLAAHFRLTSGQIRDAAASAFDAASRRGEFVTGDDLFVAARAHSNPRLSSLANKILPRYTWDDIILPADQRALLAEIIMTVRNRPQVLEEWGVGEKLVSSRGVTVLFAGPPGTGKTMAAEIIAGELGLDLFKIDLSTIISKYIGETEKNLERIFSEAASSNAILFFDEADALFGKRSEVRDSHDRYANIEISYLLQRMEVYDGITILATNLRANLDEAFTRRLQFSVDFPFPEEEDRLRIWQSLFPPGVPRAPDLDLALLAQRFKLAGGNIRNILVSAAYLAASDGGQVTMNHLLHGARRELQKMGRLLGAEDQFTQ